MQNLLPLITAFLLSTTSLPNLLENPDFEDGLQSWQRSGSGVEMAPARIEGSTAARIAVPATAEVGYPHLFQEIECRPGAILQARVKATCKNVRDGYGAYAAIEYYGVGPDRLSFVQSDSARRDDRWSTLRLRTVVPSDAKRARLCLILNGHGEAFFDDAAMEVHESQRATPFDGSVTLRVRDEIACRSLVGFGAEDDGWFYNEENGEKGVTEEDCLLRDRRIEWMDPDWVRMFFWHKDWCPSGDWETFTFDSPNMKSHYRTLDLYQRIGARVNVTGTEWGMTDPYGEPERFAQALGSLIEHLVHTKGYSCIRYWTLTNEPNGGFALQGYPFDRYVQIHRLVADRFASRGLDVQVVGSDDTAGYEWFEDCARNEKYREAADLFASHRYFPYADRVLAPCFFNDRLQLLSEMNLEKPFVVAEFGFQDRRSGTLENPIMETYPYALWTADFVIEGLLRGVAGFSIWCLHEVYYPGNGFMNYGLWDFKDNDWKPRPVYHAWSQFSRLTEAGDTSYRCESSHPSRVKGSVVNNTLFWVNASEEAAKIGVTGRSLREVRIHTEETLFGDRECGRVEAVENGTFEAPPLSFGTAE